MNYLIKTSKRLFKDLEKIKKDFKYSKLAKYNTEFVPFNEISDVYI